MLYESCHECDGDFPDRHVDHFHGALSNLAPWAHRHESGITAGLALIMAVGLDHKADDQAVEVGGQASQLVGRGAGLVGASSGLC